MSVNITDKSMALLAQMAYYEVVKLEENDLYSDMVRGQLTVRDLIEAYRSNEITDKNTNCNVDALSEFTDEEIDDFLAECGDFKIKDTIDYNGSNESGLYGYLIEISPNQALFSFRGSEDFIQEWNDWDNNLDLLSEIQTPQQKDLEEWIKKNKGKLSKYDSFFTTGHSLGGNLALYFTVASDLSDKVEDCRVFNAPGFNEEFIDLHADNIKKKQSIIKEYQNEHDIVSSLLNNPTTPIITPASSEKYIFFGHHKIIDFKFNDDGSLITELDLEKDKICSTINILSIEFDQYHDSPFNYWIDTIYNAATGNSNIFELLISGFTVGTTLVSHMLFPHMLIDGYLNMINQLREKFEWQKNNFNQDIFMENGAGIDLLMNYFQDVAQKSLNKIKDLSYTVIQRVKESIKNILEVLEKHINKIKNFIKLNLSKYSSVGGNKVSNDYGNLLIDTTSLDYVRTKLQSIERRMNDVQRKLSKLKAMSITTPELLEYSQVINFFQPEEVTNVKKYVNLVIKEMSDCELYIKRKSRLF